MFLKTYGEVREQLQQLQNPLFLYDNDADGLCSFLLLRRWLGRGNGAAVRSYPDVSEQYLQKIDYTKADGLVVLDRHALSEEIIAGVKDRGLSIIWIDHHDVADTQMQKDSDFIFYFNSRFTLKSKNSYPVSLHAYKITEQKNDAWIALVGCISDHHLPSFHKEVVKAKPELWAKGIKTPFDAYYKTEIGKIGLYLNFALKDSASSVLEMQDFMLKVMEPEQVLAENDENPIIEHSSAMHKKQMALVDEAKKTIEGNTIFFAYSGETSMSSEISNSLIHEFPKHHIGVAFIKQGVVNVSLRGKGVKKLLEKILAELGTGTGGGHPDAVGSRIPRNKLPDFEKLFRENAGNIKNAF